METGKPLYHGHRARLRERMKKDPAALADYEVLELLLAYVLVRKDTKPLAKQLLERFGNLREVMNALPAELESVPGCGEGVLTMRLLVREVMARCAEVSTRERQEFCTAEAVARMASTRLAGCPHEEVWVSTVDAMNRQISWERIAKGTVSGAPCYPRDVVELVLLRKASGFFLVHNHPGGTPHASAKDIEMTRFLETAAITMGFRFLDHIIVFDGTCYSMNKGGLVQIPLPSDTA